ncbi:RHS repeat-associated core domain-containing protein [Fulvivirga sp. M361]|nr:RHS repeat-associated core domain-containing protein [Fulvivirga sp. M361]
MVKDMIIAVKKVNAFIKPSLTPFMRVKWIVFLLLVSFQSYGQLQFFAYRCLPPTVIKDAYIADPDRNTSYIPGEVYDFNFVVFDRFFPPSLPKVFASHYEWRLDGKKMSSGEALSVRLTLPPLDNGIHVLELVPLKTCYSLFNVIFFVETDNLFKVIRVPNSEQKTFIKQLRVVNPCEPNVVMTYAGTDTEICSGTTQLYRLNNAVDGYSWSADNGATVSVNGFEANVTFPLEGNYTVTATKNNNAACVYSIDAEVGVNPKAIDFIDGLFNTCQGNTQEFTVVGAQNADVLNWTFPAGVTHTFPEATRRTALVTFPNTGNFNIGVVAQNSCGSGTSTSFDVNVEAVSVKDPEETFTHGQLSTLPTTQLVLNTCEERASSCLGKLQALALNVQLDLGDIYNWGEQEFTTQVDFSMTGKDASGVTLFTENGILAINKDNPRALYKHSVSTNFADLRTIDVAITNYPGSGGIVDNTVRFKVWYEDQVEISVGKIKLSSHTAVPVSIGSWNVRFSWNSTCSIVGNYQLRLLRLFEGETVPDELDLRWSNATIIETTSADMFTDVVLAEGSGQYLWQVRPVGNKPGKVANPGNLPLWPSTIHTLNFTQPDEEKNFIYSRTFTEGNRTSQQLTFANGLNQVQQQQTKLEEANQVVVTQSLQDYSGRDVLQSLPVPVKGKAELGYQPDLVSNGTGLFTAADFDADIKVNDPSLAYLDKLAGDNGYYGGTDNGINEKVPDASGVPYTRTLFANDGTGRPKAQAGVGGTHGLKGGKTVRYFYTSVAQQELGFMFGSEAPAASNTHKEIMVDANNTASVTYKAKDGAAIATALVIGTGNDNVEGLDSRQAATRAITETIDVESAIATGVSSATKRLVFTIPTGLHVNYTLSSGTIQELCSNTCKTCDYEVTFILHNEKDPSDTKVLSNLTINATAVDCTSRVPFQRDTLMSLQAGSYILEKRVRSGNRAATGNLYIEDHLAMVRSFYDNELATTFNPMDAYLSGASIDLQGLYNYLNLQGLVPITPDTGDPYYEVSIGCDGDMVRVPFLQEDCEEQLTCDEIKNLDFVQYFVDYWTDKFDRSSGEPGALNPAVPVSTRRSFRRYETYRFLRLDYSPIRRSISMLPTEFNRMMHNFLAETDNLGVPLYDCQIVWDIWRQQVQNYEYLSNMHLDPSDTPEGFNPVNYEYNFIHNFFRTIEIELGETETDPERQFIRKEGFFEGRLTSVIMERIYELFYYNPEDEAMSNCMEGYIDFYNSNPDNTPCNQATLTQRFDCLTYTERHKIYQCVNFGDYTVGNPEDELQKNLDRLTSRCLRSCEDRREAFEQAIIDDIHNQDLYIEGDAFLLEFDSVRQVKILTGSPRDPAVFDIDACEIEAMTDALVANCEGYCEIGFIRHPTSGEIIGVDTLEQRTNLQKVLTADFEVSVNANGNSNCSIMVGSDVVSGNNSEGNWGVVRTLMSTDLNYLTNYSNNRYLNHFRDTFGNYYVLYTGQPFHNVRLNTGVDLTGSTAPYDFYINKFNPQGELVFTKRLEVSILSAIGLSQTSPTLLTDSLAQNSESPSLNQTTALAASTGGLANASFNFNVNMSGSPSSGNIYFNVDNDYDGPLDFEIKLDGMVVHTSNRANGVITDNTVSMDTNGYVRWVRDETRDYYTSGGHQVVVDGQENVYSIIYSPYSQIIKRDQLGGFKWFSNQIRVSNGSAISRTGQFAVDSNGNCYYLDYYISPINTSSPLNVTLNGAVIDSTNSQQGYLLVKLNPDGSYGWHKFFSFDGENNPRRTEIKLHAKENSVVVFNLHRDKLINGAPPLIDAQLSLLEYTSLDGSLLNDRIINGASSISLHVSALYENELNFYILHPRSNSSPYLIEIAKNDLTATIIGLNPPLFEDFNANVPAFTTFYKSGENYEFTAMNSRTQGNLGGKIIEDLVFDNDYFLAKYSPSTSSCSYPSLCFRFGDPIQDIPIPPGFEPYVFKAQPLTCEELNVNSVIASLDYQKQHFLDTKLEVFRNDYETNCLDATKVNDQFTISYDLGYHHYTLYYYDRAGNLMRTVPPKGFNTVDPETHTLTTNYHYNSLGQLVNQNSPDGGETRFYYNDIGQLRFSQNARQQVEGTYSYTKYDRLGRIVEVGQSTEGINVFTRRINSMDFPVTGEEKTVTIYNQAYGGTLSYLQRYLRNRVSYSYLDEDGLDTTTNDRTYTVYSYDPHGNVEWLEQIIPGLEQKYIAYSYDLLSGNVLQVKYNPGQPDQFYHKYEYDADNRITAVFTSLDGHLWDKDAEYHYYPHGPLKEAIVGQDKVQELDYTYTIHGWLKAINDPATNDPMEVLTGKDAFAMALNYYSGDYQRSGSTLGSLTPASNRDLYNGNISAWEMATHASDDSWMHTGYQYTYDELNRIRDSRFNVGRDDIFYNRGGFQADFTLDANGNLVTLDRNDIDANHFDALTYHLQNGKNRLDHVSDAITDAELHAKDIETQTIHNYEYDSIGNLVRDHQEGMNIEWTVYGKVDELIKTNGGTRFTYDPAGNRVRKQTTDEFGNEHNTYYIRDAGGNIMATYRREDIAGVAGTAVLKEIPLYGSDRIGVYTPEGAFENNQQPSVNVSTNTSVNTYQGVSYDVDQGVSLTLEPGFSYEDGVDGDLFNIAGPGSTDGTLPANVYVRHLDHKQYELKDHLGNVRTVVSDRKLSTVTGSTPSDFRPAIISASSYYPYGMDLPTVHWEPDTSIATMEPADVLLELPEFHNYADVPVSYDPVFNHTETYVNQGVGGTPSASVKLTAANDSSIIGLAKSLKVQAGDKITMKVYGKYTTPQDLNNLTNVAASLGDAFVDAFAFQGTQEGMALGQFFSDLFAEGITFAGTNDNTEQVNAYLNYLFFDNDYVLQNAGFASLRNGAREDGTNITHDSLKFELIPQQDGYLYIYTSNESPQVTDVYFDDFMVVHERLVPDVAYDPDLLGYRYGFNGKEKDQQGEWGLNHYDYGFRIYNPALGRFLSVDPLTKSYPMLTPYQYASNNSITLIDLDGLEGVLYPGQYQGYSPFDANQDRHVSKVELETGVTVVKGIVLTGAAIGVGAYALPYVVTEAQLFLSAPGAYLYNLFSDPSKVETIFETTIDVLSPDGGPINTTSVVPDVEDIVVKGYGEYLLKTYSKKIIRKKFHRLSAITNKRTGYTYVGRAGGIRSLNDPSIHPELRKRLSKKQIEDWNQANCAECDAANQALWDGASWDELSDPRAFEFENVDGGKWILKEKCDHCEVTFSDKIGDDQ